MLSQALKSRTVWFGVLIGVLSVLQGYVFLLPLSPEEQMLVGVAVSVVVVVLRFATTQPVMEK